MAAYSLFFRASLEKDFTHIPKKDLKKILRRIGMLSKNPRPVGCEKLSGQEWYRIRQGRYRIVYSIEDKALTLWIVKVGHRKDIYH
ncbi:type II toxin-antitoxin system RelE/ParE family toxin [Nitrospira defluvii]|nr:type II toxin-antitoxin system RelE/ParE family toxin [Nitrospira defluvii]